MSQASQASAPGSVVNLSLYQIEHELLDLMRFREDVAQDADMTPEEAKASLKAIDNQITEYVHREIVKVDGIAAYLRECDARSAVLKEEAARIYAQAQVWSRRRNQLYEITLRVMQQTGATQLDGANSTVKVKKNPPSVDVAQPELVPAAYNRWQVTMNGDLFSRLMAHLMGTPKGSPLYIELQGCEWKQIGHMKDAIKQELKAGVGVPGCRLVDDKVRLVVE